MARTKKTHGSPTRAIGYVRCSTDEQRLGPEAQREALSAWCTAQGVELVAVFEDVGVSGAAPLDKRPGLLGAIDALRPSGAGTLLALKRDRIARDLVAAAMVERLAEREGARVLCADGAGNGDSPEAQAMRGMLDVFAQYERAVIRSRTRAALGVKKARGERVGRVPYGFRVGGDGKTLEPDAGEQAVLETMRDMRAAGLTLQAIVAELEAAGMVGRSGKRIGIATVHRMLVREGAAA